MLRESAKNKASGPLNVPTPAGATGSLNLKKVPSGGQYQAPSLQQQSSPQQAQGVQASQGPIRTQTMAEQKAEADNRVRNASRNAAVLPSGTRISIAGAPRRSTYQPKPENKIYRGNASENYRPGEAGTFRERGGIPVALVQDRPGERRGSRYGISGGPRGAMGARGGRGGRGAGRGGRGRGRGGRGGRPQVVKRVIAEPGSEIPHDAVIDASPSMMIRGYHIPDVKSTGLESLTPGSLLTESSRTILLNEEIGVLDPEETATWSAAQWKKYDNRRLLLANATLSGQRPVLEQVNDPGRMGQVYKTIMRNDSYDTLAESSIMYELGKRLPATSTNASR